MEQEDLDTYKSGLLIPNPLLLLLLLLLFLLKKIVLENSFFFIAMNCKPYLIGFNSSFFYF